LKHNDDESPHEEILEISEDMIEEDEIHLNYVMDEKKIPERKEDRSRTVPTEINSTSQHKKSVTTIKSNKSKLYTETLAEPEISKNLTGATSKSFSLSKSIINQKELIDLKGPISSEIFFSMKNTPILDDYQFGRILGEGSYGQVKLVRHIRTNVELAMKVVKKAGVPEEEKLLMMKEVSILKTLDHPNIIKVFDLYEDDSKIYIITE
jgi:Protein kinase domain